QAHAATAFLTSPFARAAVIVCDTHADRELTVWVGNDGHLEDRCWPWRGRAFASLYSECAKLFADGAAGDAHTLELLAHLGHADRCGDLADVFRHADGSIEVAAGSRATLHQRIISETQQRGHARDTAAAIQRRLGELLLEVVADIRASVNVDAVCLGG